MKIRYLPKNLKLGGTKLYHGLRQNTLPRPDGVRRANNTCIELETYSNLTRGGAAGFIGVSIMLAPAMCLALWIILNLDSERLFSLLMVSPILPCFAVIFYFASGAHRCRGAFIRINRATRKLYFTYPNNKNHLHEIDWDKVEALAGIIPIVSAHGYTTRHPLYLFGIDYSLNPPTEICAACGNLGIIGGDKSARSLWAYLQHFMEKGLDGLPEPPPMAKKLSRRQAAIQPYRDWAKSFKNELCEPKGWLWAPFTLTVWPTFFLLYACLNSSEEWIQYNVPYAAFPHDNDVLCGFVEQRKPVVRVNGVKLDEP